MKQTQGYWPLIRFVPAMIFQLDRIDFRFWKALFQSSPGPVKCIKLSLISVLVMVGRWGGNLWFDLVPEALPLLLHIFDESIYGGPGITDDSKLVALLL